MRRFSATMVAASLARAAQSERQHSSRYVVAAMRVHGRCRQAVADCSPTIVARLTIHFGAAVPPSFMPEAIFAIRYEFVFTPVHASYRFILIIAICKCRAVVPSLRLILFLAKNREVHKSSTCLTNATHSTPKYLSTHHRHHQFHHSTPPPPQISPLPNATTSHDL
jgi:hypothetical protein